MCATVVSGQYIPHSGQPFQFASVYNPAFTGFEQYSDLKLGYRYQWTGFGDYAPQFVNLTYNVRLQEPLDLNLNALRSSTGDMRDHIPKTRQMVHAVGGLVFSEKVGLINRVGVGGSYGFHYPVNKKINIAAGFAAVLENTRLKVDQLYLGANPDPDSFYDNLLRTGSNQTYMGFRAGALLYTDYYYIGISYLPLTGASLRSSDVDFTEPYYRSVVQAGYSHPLSADIFFKPSIVAILQTNNRVLIDLNTKFYFLNKGWAGLTYRTSKSGLANIGININERYGVGYSYEFSMGRFQQFSGGSHEIILSARLKNYRGFNPRIW